MARFAILKTLREKRGLEALTWEYGQIDGKPVNKLVSTLNVQDDPVESVQLSRYLIRGFDNHIFIDGNQAHICIKLNYDQEKFLENFIDCMAEVSKTDRIDEWKMESENRGKTTGGLTYEAKFYIGTPPPVDEKKTGPSIEIDVLGMSDLGEFLKRMFRGNQ